VPSLVALNLLLKEGALVKSLVPPFHVDPKVEDWRKSIIIEITHY
jgi:hypothetical protein